MKTFLMTNKQGQHYGEPVPYRELRIEVSGVQHVLAVHKNTAGGWTVSEPKSGASVIASVAGSYKGIRVSSSGSTPSEMYRNAANEVGYLIDRVGAEKFNKVLADAEAATARAREKAAA